MLPTSLPAAGAPRGRRAAPRRSSASEVDGFLAWLRGADVAPTVAALRARAEEVVERRAAPAYAQRRPELTDEQRAEVARTVHRVVQRLLHSPTVRVRQLAAAPGGDAVRGRCCGSCSTWIVPHAATGPTPYRRHLTR